LGPERPRMKQIGSKSGTVPPSWLVHLRQCALSRPKI
jgi:hypothetical protein